MTPTAGTRLRCEQCGAEAIVISAAAPELTCCDQPLTATFTREHSATPSGRQNTV